MKLKRHIIVALVIVAGVCAFFVARSYLAMRRQQRELERLRNTIWLQVRAKESRAGAVFVPLDMRKSDEELIGEVAGAVESAFAAKEKEASEGEVVLGSFYQTRYPPSHFDPDLPRADRLFAGPRIYGPVYLVRTRDERYVVRLAKSPSLSRPAAHTQPFDTKRKCAEWLVSWCRAKDPLGLMAELRAMRTGAG